MTDPTVPMMAATIAAGLVDLVIVAAAIPDWKTSRRVHPAYAIGGICIVLVHVLRIPFSQTGPWHAIANALLALGA